MVKPVNYDDSRISILCDHLDTLQDLKEFSQLTDQTGLISLDFAYDLYAKDPGYLQVARTDLVFLTMLYEGPVSLLLIPSSLATELQKIGLSKEELHEVISDLQKCLFTLARALGAKRIT